MVGRALQTALPEAEIISHKKIDLSNKEQVKGIFNDFDYVIHLAAKVGGLANNTKNVGDFYLENIQINTNVLEEAKRAGVKKVVSLLSSCIYPEEKYISYPLTEEQLHSGPPHVSNFGYAYAKRMLDIQSKAFRQQFGCNFITAIPNNLYGPHDQFSLEDSHVLPALMRKIWQAKINNQEVVEIWGDGSPLREFTYVEDVAKIIIWLLENYNEPEPINIGTTTEISIKEAVEKIIQNMNFQGKLFWNTNKPMGQHKKPTSNKKLLSLMGDEIVYTPFEIGLKKTCKWFMQNYPNVRGIK